MRGARGTGRDGDGWSAVPAAPALLADASCTRAPATHRRARLPGATPRRPARLEKLSPLDVLFNATRLEVTTPAPLNKLQQYVQEVAAAAAANVSRRVGLFAAACQLAGCPAPAPAPGSACGGLPEGAAQACSGRPVAFLAGSTCALPCSAGRVPGRAPAAQAHWPRPDLLRFKSAGHLNAPPFPPAPTCRRRWTHTAAGC